jgi:hypothetical protein
MSEVDLIIGFLVGLIAGAYGAYLAHPIIEGGVALLKLQNLENKRVDAEEKAANEAASKNLATPSNPLFPEKPPN